MSPFSSPEPDESLDFAADEGFAIEQPVVVHLPGAADSAADRRMVDLILQLRPGLLFVAGSVS